MDKNLFVALLKTPRHTIKKRVVCKHAENFAQADECAFRMLSYYPTLRADVHIETNGRLGAMLECVYGVDYEFVKEK